MQSDVCNFRCCVGERDGPIERRTGFLPAVELVEQRALHAEEKLK